MFSGRSSIWPISQLRADWAYFIDIDPFSRNYLTIGLGFDAQVGDG